jgi:formylglycine-generating enzyme required for sulfatase activity
MPDPADDVILLDQIVDERTDNEAVWLNEDAFLDPDHTKERAETARRERWLMMSLGAALLLLLVSGGAGAWWIIGGRSSDAGDSPTNTEAIAADAEPVVTNEVGMRMILIPAGEFRMGAPDSKEWRTYSGRQASYQPRHLVRITQPFYLQAAEVTQGQWESVMGTQPWHEKYAATDEDKQDGRDNPAVAISWEDAVDFCRKLSQEEGVTYRLPTEAEWEYACRAGTTTKFSFGDDETKHGGFAWIEGDIENATRKNTETFHQVRQKTPNAWGLYDMHGNVWEWCHDRFDRTYYSRSPLDDPAGPESGSTRVTRGGCWNSSPADCSCAARASLDPTAKFTTHGFRVVRGRLPLSKTDSGETPSASDQQSPQPATAADAPELTQPNDQASEPIGKQAGEVREFKTAASSINFCWCPPGDFMMGSPPDEPGHKEDENQVEVTLTHGFWLSEKYATRGQWKRVMGSSSPPWKSRRGDNRLAFRVNYYDAEAFCKLLTLMEHHAGRLPRNWAYKLPTEAQWEYACRAGTTTPFWFVPDPEKPVGPHIHPWGVMGFYTGTREWCRDRYADHLLGGIDPTGPVWGPIWVVRSGRSYNYIGDRSAARRVEWPINRRPKLRIACVRVPQPKVPLTLVTSTRVEKRAGTVIADNALKLKLIWCAPGSFWMRDRSNRQVAKTLTEGYWIGQTEVSRIQWSRIMQTEPWNQEKSVYRGPLERKRNRDHDAATSVSYDDAKAFCERFTEVEHIAGRLPSDWEYTLPTEAQWDYSCRAGTGGRFFFGDSERDLNKYGRSSKRIKLASAKTVYVKTTNPWGLDDVYGNVAEWCGQPIDGTDPGSFPKGSQRPIRGGSSGRSEFGKTQRSQKRPEFRSNELGFRVACTLSRKK